jgi:hypothetical protein
VRINALKISSKIEFQSQTQRVEEIHQVNPVAITFPKKRKSTAPHFITPLNGKIVDQGADILLEGIIDGNEHDHF